MNQTIAELKHPSPFIFQIIPAHLIRWATNDLQVASVTPEPTG
jgi:hypothetical protein